MDWLKVSIERFFAFLATLIPGSAVLLLFVLHRQGTLESLWKTEVLTYETKIAIVIFCTFAAGLAVQDCLTRVGGAIGGAIRGFFGASEAESVEEDEVQPWRNRVWRALLKGYLGPSAPEDIQYVYKSVLEKKLELIASSQHDERTRATEALAVLSEKAKADAADYEWSIWWRQLHVPALFRWHSPFVVMMETLSGNFHSASLILIFAMPWTPALRHWWILVFCLYWNISLLVQGTYIVWSARDPWSSFNNQLEYLQTKMHSAKGNDVS